LPQKKVNPLSPDLAPYLLSAVLLTIPLAYIVNSIAVALFALFTIFTAYKNRRILTVSLLLPVVFYLLLAMSFLWSIDPPETIKALSKVLPFLVLPVCFCFIKIDGSSRQKALKLYSYGIVVYGIFYLIKAIVRFYISGDSNVFFYHELVTKDVNAIYISAMFSVAFFYFLAKRMKKIGDYAALLFILLVIVLLSSKNIIVINVLIIAVYYLFFAPFSRKAKFISVVLVLSSVLAIGYFSKIKDRIMAEVQPKAQVHEASPSEINNLTIYEAYTLPEFQANDYFNGSAFRAYQVRIFFELLREDNIFFSGYGLNASLGKIKEKGIKYNVYQGDSINEGYNELNFHNQYLETFADAGIFALLLLLLMHVFNFKNALGTKDFVHIAFAILMISLFLTESLLCRQRGVVFFITLYCLFNTNLSGGYTKKEI